MGKTNRGETTKLSIRLTAAARERIEKAANNLNLSKAGVILFALSNILREFPEKHTVLNMEQNYDLETGNFALTINKELSEKLNDIHNEYGMSKNVLFGLVISDYFEKRVEEALLEDRNDADPKNISVTVNSDLKKKIDEFSEKYYIPLSGIVAYSVLKGSVNYLPTYSGNESESFLTTIPEYLAVKVKEESANLHIRESFYAELCLYKVFSSEKKVF